MDSNNLSESILQAAQQEFAKNGFHDTAVSDIADRANVGKGTVYRHFGNKETLFGTLLKQGIQKIQEQTEGIVADSESAWQAVEQILEMHFQIFDESKELLEIIINEGKHKIGAMRDVLLEEDMKHRKQIADQFARGIREGYFKDMDPEKMAVMFQGFIWSVLRSSIIYGEENPREKYLPLLSEIFFKGVA
ncbi:MAG: TetR/AcrR family transcriptional regulator [Thermodesulfobacteriota bacterium]